MARSDQGPAANDMRRIGVHVIADRSGQILRNQLLDDLGAAGSPQPPLYTIEIKLSEPRQEIAIRRDETASRVAYSAYANFTLRTTAGQVLFSSGSASSSTYEATTSEFASIAGQRSARDRAMQELSADIRQQIAAYFFRTRRAAESTGPATPRP